MTEEYQSSGTETVGEANEQVTSLQLATYRPEEELFERLYLCEYLSELFNAEEQR